VKIYWREKEIYLPSEKIEDKNNDGIYDYVEWNSPVVNDSQTFDIIIQASDAEHLDENRSFISDNYEQIKFLDNVWSDEIKNNEYLRVTFEKNLTSSRDITLYPRVISGTPSIEVYEKDKSEKIAEFLLLPN